MIKKALVLGVVLSTLAASPALAWEKIGSRRVSDRADIDVITVSGSEHFRRVKICVYKNPVRFYDVDIRFANGGHQDVSVRRRINAGGCTRAIDLNGGARNITTITLKYEETSRRRARAKVKVFAE